MDMLYSQSQSVSASKLPPSASLSMSAKSAVSDGTAATALVPYNGSTMLSPPLTASCTNPFSSFDWLSAVTPPSVDSSNGVSTSSGNSIAEQRAAAAAAAAAVAYNSCRFGQPATAAGPSDFLSMFSSTCGPPSFANGSSTSNGFNAELTSMPAHHQSPHNQLRQNQHHHNRHNSRNQNGVTDSSTSSTISSAIVSSSSSSTSSLSLTPTSMTSSPAVPSPHKINAAALFNPPGYHLQPPGHGLPSPTIYPPTPPPSAPWIHPWYTGDTF